MDYILLAIFVIGYVGIVLEHQIKIDKAASALLTGTVLWGLFVVGYTEVPAHLADFFSSFSAGDGHASLSVFYEHCLVAILGFDSKYFVFSFRGDDHC